MLKYKNVFLIDNKIPLELWYYFDNYGVNWYLVARDGLKCFP